MLFVNPQITLPESELELTYARSSGPGGQNVNKVNSKAVLRWNPGQSSGLPPQLRDRILARLAPRLTTEGDLVISSDRFRDQGRNREDCLQKLREILLAASAVPKIRKKTKPSRSSQKKRRESKSLHSLKKRLRSRDY
jgi:ribosome-associated protein